MNTCCKKGNKFGTLEKVSPCNIPMELEKRMPILNYRIIARRYFFVFLPAQVQYQSHWQHCPKYFEYLVPKH